MLDEKSKAILEIATKLLSESPTYRYVLAFSLDMERKLDVKRHKGDRNGWLAETPEWLHDYLKGEVDELRSEIDHVDGDPSRVINEAADVANLAMMVADSYGDRHSGTEIGRTAASPSPAPPRAGSEGARAEARLRRVLDAWMYGVSAMYGHDDPVRVKDSIRDASEIYRMFLACSTDRDESDVAAAEGSSDAPIR